MLLNKRAWFYTAAHASRGWRRAWWLLRYWTGV